MFKKTIYHSLSNNVAKTLLLSAGVVSSASAEDYIVPAMVNIPAGSFMMGTESGDAWSKPMLSVSLPAFQMAKYPVTVAEFRKFVEDTGFNPNPTCNDTLNENWLSGPDEVGSASWDNHRYSQSEYQPVTCVSWQSANAYAKWLSKKAGTIYRLPTEQEFEYAQKANTTSRYFWGDDPNMTQACLYGNFADQSGEYFASKQYGASYVGFLEHANCDDGEAYNSIVGLYRPNPFGLYDMVGNISQFLSTCYYEGYEKRTEEEMDIDKCEFIGHRGETWHYPPQPHYDRGRAKKEEVSPGALMGFRLAVNGHSDKKHSSTTKFEEALQLAQANRLATRPKLPVAPKQTQLIKLKNNKYRLSWQPSDDIRVSGYDIYQSDIPSAHHVGQFYQRYYTKVQTVDANKNSVIMTLPEEGGSFRIVTKTEQLTSLPSLPAVYVEPNIVQIPGRIYMQDSVALENVRLAYSRTKDDPEPYYLSKMNNAFDQPSVTATFNVNVKESGFYTLNYRGRSFKEGEFFKLWQNNKLVGEMSYDAKIDDKTSNRHKVFLDRGTHQLQLMVALEGWNRWSMTWLELAEVKS